MFLAGLLRDPIHTGAVAPSGRPLANAMAAEVDPAAAGIVVELGGGTGSITKALLARGIAPHRLVSVEYNPMFAARLRERFPRITVLEGDAAELGKLLDANGYGAVSAVVSGLPLLNMKPPVRQEIVRQSLNRLMGRGPLVQFTYGLGSPFGPLDEGVDARPVRRIWRNLPPARVWRVEAQRQRSRAE